MAIYNNNDNINNLKFMGPARFYLEYTAYPKGMTLLHVGLPYGKKAVFFLHSIGTMG